MQAITKKLHDKAIESFRGVVEQMASEGCAPEQIKRAYQNHIQNKTKALYQSGRGLKKPSFNLGDLPKADSKVEMIFYNLMVESGIKFSFQHNIGPYRADYLVMKFLVIEIDGPQHVQEKDDRRDKYLRKMGYKVIRIPIWVLASCPEAAIQEIQEVIKIRRVK